MGGDLAPKQVLDGVSLLLENLPDDVILVLYGDKSSVDLSILSHKSVEVVHTTQVIEMCQHPAKAFQSLTDSSITVGFQHLKQGKIDAFAGAGNTGAMLVGGMYTVKTIPGVIRPAITTMIPKEHGGYGVMLDVGANSDCRPDILLQFGLLGQLYAKFMLNIETPKIGLMNIGEEEEKGNLLTQATHKIMKETDSLNFIGNIEGRDLFNDKADVIVCDGFVGNIILKNTESFFRLLTKRKIKDEFFDRFNYEDYGGSPILGLNKPVIIGHGMSSPVAIQNMIKHAIGLCKSSLIEKIAAEFN